ncbi:MAG: dUTP diphosphatase [Lactobacillales bacterium]|jgi:dUTP pyrophosphatase|nr:dUTP diphosphatase [Lactobacillales bacterium]
MRGFKIAKGFENSGVNLPERATAHAAGYDFEAASDFVIEPGKIGVVPTGIKSYMEADEFLQLCNRSSNPKKRGLALANGVGIVDSDYYENPDNDGAIGFLLMNITDAPVEIKKGERIGQGIFIKYLLAEGDEFSGASRDGGFGSTGK